MSTPSLMAEDANAAGGSVLVAEVLRQRAVRERARWEEFNRRAREEEEEGAERGRTRRAPARGGDNGDDDSRAAGARNDEVDETPTAATVARTEPTDGDDDDDDEPMCRICFGGEEDDAKGADRLFAPCQCRGSQGLVHVRCLNQWRARSRNNASYFECNTCHYRYHLERAAWAGRLEDPRVLAATSGCLVFFAVLSVGVFVRLTSTRAARLFAWIAAVAKREGHGNKSRHYAAAVDLVTNLGNPRPSHSWRDSVRAALEACTAGATCDSPALRSSLREAHRVVTRAVALVDASPLHLEFAFYRVVEWLPPWWCVGALDGWNDHFRNGITIDQLVGGSAGGGGSSSADVGSWRRRWWWWSPRHCAGDVADALDTVVAGLVVLGFTAFGWNLGRRLRGNFRFNFEHLLLPLAMMVSSHGARTARLIVPLGVMGGYYEVYRAVRVWSKELLTRFGERVLEVRPRPG